MTYTLRNEFAWMLFAVVIAACLALFISVQSAYFALLFAAIAWWTYLNPERAFLFLLILMPLLPMFKVTQTIGNITLIKDIVILTLFLQQFLIPLLTQKLQYRRNVFLFPMLALLGWAAISTLMADSLTLGILRARDIVLYMCLYMAVLYLPHSKEIMRTRLMWFAWGLGGLLVLALYQWFFASDAAVLRFDPARSIWIPRISSTLGHPSVFGEYLIIAFSICSALFLSLKKDTRLRSFLLITVAAILSFIYLTYSRGVWLGLVVAICSMAAVVIRHSFHFSIEKKKVWTILTSTICGALIILFLLLRFTPVGTFLRSAFDPTYPSNQIRLQFVNRLIASTSNTEAFFGRGLGDVVEQTFRNADITGEEVVSGDSRSVQLSKDSTLVDNQYLKTFIEMGLAGLLLYAWIYIRFFTYSTALTYTHDVLARILGYLGIGFIAAFVIQALFVDIWDVFPTNAYFWIVAAFISQASLTNTQKESRV